MSEDPGSEVTCERSGPWLQSQDPTKLIFLSLEVSRSRGFLFSFYTRLLQLEITVQQVKQVDMQHCQS